MILVPNLDLYMFPTQMVQKSLGTEDLINPWRTSLLLMQQRFVTRYDSLSWTTLDFPGGGDVRSGCLRSPSEKITPKVVLVGTYTLWIFEPNYFSHKKHHILKVGEFKYQTSKHEKSTCKRRRGHETWRQPQTMYQIKEELQQITFALFDPPGNRVPFTVVTLKEKQTKFHCSPKVHLFRFILFDDFL